MPASGSSSVAKGGLLVVFCCAMILSGGYFVLLQDYDRLVRRGLVVGSPPSEDQDALCGPIQQQQQRQQEPSPAIAVGNATTDAMVGMAVVIDDWHRQHKYAKNLESLELYADKHGYEFFVLSDKKYFPSCQYQSVFFRKHCTISHFLKTKPHNYNLFVFDGDCYVVSPNISLAKWLAYDVDVLLYDRGWNFEIMAGNYLVRNNEFGHYFLQTWTNYAYRSSIIQGFNSADNGAIHLVVLDVVGMYPEQDYQPCNRIYQKLTSNVNDLHEYYSFVACTRRYLGPSRIWITQGLVPNAKLAVLNRYHGFVVDEGVGGARRHGNVPILHGVKNATDTELRLVKNGDWPSLPHQARQMAQSDDFWLCANHCRMPWKQVPRTRLATCLIAPEQQQQDGTIFGCEPLGMNDPPHYRLFLNHRTQVLFDYSWPPPPSRRANGTNGDSKHENSTQAKELI